jgi:hypothetical protein
METAQNTKQIIVDTKVEELWEGNSHIPFMQSKEILRYGITEGMELSVKNTEQPTNQSETQSKNQSTEIVKDDFIGTTNDLIRHAENKINKNTNANIDNHNKIAHEDILCEKARYSLLNELYDYIIKERDLMNVYYKINNMLIESSRKIKNYVNDSEL